MRYLRQSRPGLFQQVEGLYHVAEASKGAGGLEVLSAASGFSKTNPQCCVDPQRAR